MTTIQKKLVRTQVMLDKDALEKIKPLLLEKGISLAQYIRDLMDDEQKKRESLDEDITQLRLSLAGSVPAEGIDPNAAINHDDIYYDTF